MDLNTATSRQVDAALAELGASPSTVGRSRTFFLNAADEAGIPVGQLLRNAPRAPSSPRKRARKITPPGDDKPDDTPLAKRQGLPAFMTALVSKIPTEAEGWNEEEARQWIGLAKLSIAYDYKLDLDKLKEGPS